jgi:tRNA A-37 threonylcarbamoyl transferase component Bud32
LVRPLRPTSGPWLYSTTARADDPTQGWKLHVSATVLSAAEILRCAEPILRKHRALFKVPRRLELLISLNAGLTDFSQIGKFLTAYPRSTEEALVLARELHSATRGMAGPRIPFDEPYRANTLVYYRYGAFRPSARKARGLIRGPDGRLQEDKRGPGQAVPAWLEDPFNPARRKPRKTMGAIGVDYLASKAHLQRGKGGVYEALDISVSPPRVVIIKEGRRHGETDLEGKDGYQRLRHEAKILRKFAAIGIPVPKIFREFFHNGNRYLVLEKLPGRPLIPADRLQPAKASWRRAARILQQLKPILARIHAAGWVWRDCKPCHLLVHRGELGLIDFENACRVGERKAAPWRSRDYFPKPVRGMDRRQPGTNEDNYALGVISFQFGTGRFPPSETTARATLYRRTKCPESLRARIERLLDSTI